MSDRYYYKTMDGKCVFMACQHQLIFQFDMMGPLSLC